LEWNSNQPVQICLRATAVHARPLLVDVPTNRQNLQAGREVMVASHAGYFLARRRAELSDYDIGWPL